MGRPLKSSRPNLYVVREENHCQKLPFRRLTLSQRQMNTHIVAEVLVGGTITYALWNRDATMMKRLDEIERRLNEADGIPKEPEPPKQKPKPTPNPEIVKMIVHKIIPGKSSVSEDNKIQSSVSDLDSEL